MALAAPAGLRPGLSGRRHAEALPALCAAPFQHDAAVLRAHADQEAVGAATPAVIRLKSALHGVFRILWGPTDALERSIDRDELTMVAKPFRACQRGNGLRPSPPRRDARTGYGVQSPSVPGGRGCVRGRPPAARSQRI